MTAKPRQKRPRRERKGDRLLSPGASRAEIMTDYAVAPFDRVATQAERKWGYDRLPELVDPDMAARYGAAISFLNDAINADDHEKAVAAAQNGIKGIAAMEAAAIAASHRPPRAIAHGKVDDYRFRIVGDAGDQSAMPQDMPTFSMWEIGVMCRAWSRMTPIEQAKHSFPGAEIVEIRPTKTRTPLEIEIDDEIPF